MHYLISCMNNAVHSCPMIQSERACQEEQNDANFSSVAPYMEELQLRKEFDQNALLHSMVFGQKMMEPISANNDTIREGISRGAE